LQHSKAKLESEAQLYRIVSWKHSENDRDIFVLIAI